VEAQLDLKIHNVFDRCIFNRGQVLLLGFATVEVCTGLEQVIGA